MRLQDMPSYCITLARRPDRWNRFADQPEVAQLPKLKKTPAVDGKTINVLTDTRINLFTKRNILFKRRRAHDEMDSVGAVGCSLSHYNIWKDFLQSGAEYAFVLEDDAVLPPGFIQEMNLLLENDPKLRAGDWDVITFTQLKKFKSPTVAPRDFADIKIFALSHAQIISRRAAQIFYDNALPVSHHVDHYMSLCCNLNSLKVLGSKLYYLPQSGSKSDIQTKPSCPMCDIPTDFDLNYSLIPHGEWYRAKASEYALLAILIAYIAYRTMKK